MDRGRPPYDERLLHWIWGELHFEPGGLTARCGTPITLLDQGVPNTTDGPDFKEVRVRIGGLIFHGDVEIHWSAEDWNRHGHHDDSRYDRVVLHVVYHEPSGIPPVKRQDGTSPYTLCLQPHLPETLHALITQFNRTHRLPCAGSIPFISEEAFLKQLERAHRSYFEEKTDRLLNRFYHPELSPSLAWKRVFILGLFDGLGITHNRDPMIELGQELFERRASVNSPEELIELARQRSGFAGSRHGERPLLLRWNRKGCRPPNRPEVRIEQAAELMWRVLATPLDTWFVRAPETLWADLTGRLVVAPGIGEGRSGILYGVVFLPALYLLGSLFRSDRLRHRAFEIWKNYRTGIPPSLFTLYRNSEIPARLYRRKLGAVYQLRHYCRPRRCQDCEVLQQAISS